jgi:ribose transport system permease protein
MHYTKLVEKLGPLLALVFVIGVFMIADSLRTNGGSFSTWRNAQVILVQTSTVAVAALGMTLIIISGGIDLSAGTALALAATVLACALREGVAPWLAVLSAVLTGGVCGLVNGALISLLRMVPFIVTLGTMTAYLGLAKIVADETTVRPRLEQVPDWLGNLVSIRPQALWVGLPSGVWLVLALSTLLAAVLRWTVFGRHVFALGSNEQTARLCGINVPLTKIIIYSLAGLFVGIGGMYQFARLSVGNPTSGIGLELQVIAAVVIGGGSLSGGQGSVLGTLTGAAIMGVIKSGCTQLGLSNPIQDILLGVIIVTAVMLDQLRHRRADR